MDDFKCLDQRTFKMLKETIYYAEDLAEALIKLNVKIPQAMIDECDVFISFFHRFLNYANTNMRPSQETQSVMNPQLSTPGGQVNFSGLQQVVSNIDETISSDCNSESGITSESSGEAQKSAFDSSSNNSSTRGPHTTGYVNSITKSDAKPDIFDKSIPELYSSYTEAILNGEISDKNIGVYCQPCNTVVNKGKAWSNHIQYKNHNKSVMHNHIDEMKVYECLKCKILVYGSEALADRFFDYHSQVSFSSGAEGCCDSLKIAIDQSVLLTSCSSVSSFKSNETRLSETSVTKKGTKNL